MSIGFAQVIKNGSSRPCTAIHSAGGVKCQPDDYHTPLQDLGSNMTTLMVMMIDDTTELRLLVL